MKRWKRRIALGLICGLMLSVTACSSADLSSLSGELDIDCSAGEIVSDSDTHGGFHGDGVMFVILEFSGDSARTEIERAGWEPLPLDSTLTALVYGEETTGPFLTDEDGNALFPEINNGYYWFADRNNENDNLSDTSAVLERASINVSVAMYDTDTDRLYFCSFDS